MILQHDLIKYTQALNVGNFGLNYVEEIGFNNNYLDVACYSFGVKKEEILGTSRKQHLVWIRYIIFNYIKQNTSLVYERIGKMFDKDHATIIHGVNKHKEFVEYKDFDYCLMVNEFNKQIKSDRFIH